MKSKRKIRGSGLAGLLALVLAFAAAASGQVVVSGSLPTAGDVGLLYSASLSATDGGGPCTCTWSITGTPPDSVTVNPTTGSVSGTPTVSGSFNFTVTATNASMQSGNVAASGTINPALVISPASLPVGQIGSAYSVAISVSNGTLPYGAVQLTGTLPTNLNFAGGSITGTPTQTGSFPLTASVTDAVGGTATANYTLQINPAPPPPPTVNPATLPQGEVTVAYTTTLTETGGTGPTFTWALASGSLPNGVSLSATGVISGTPSQSGSFPFSVQVTDSAAMTSAAQGFTLTVIAAPSISTVSPLPPGEVTAAYSQTMAASGGTNTGFTWTVSTGPITAGLSLSAAGALTGTPTAAGPSNFTVQVTDSAGGFSQRSFALNVIAGPSITTTSPLPAGEVTSPYSQTLAASGGSGAGFSWAVTAGFLPAGLSLSAAGAITGTPTASGISNFTVTVTDSGGGSAVLSFALTINGGLSITTPASLPAGEATAPYSQTLAASGGTNAGFAWSITTGALPLGLSLSAAGAITGTPTTTGLSNFTVKVTDSGGGSATLACSLNIIAGPSITTVSPLPQGELTAAYSRTLAASGGTAAGFTWTVSTGSLPAGLSLSAAGAITGTPTATGPSSFAVQVVDSGGGKATQNFTLAVIAGPTITTNATLPKGEVGSAYSQTLSASGGSAAGFVWSVASGSSLPAGLALSAAGVLSGTPTAAALGTDSFAVQVTDSGNGVATLTMSITIIAGPTISTAPVLPNGTVGVAYTTVTLAAAGGTLPYVWSITLGSLPPGLSLAASAGTITGMPTTATGGPSNFTVQLIDAKGVATTKVFSVTIAAGLTITTAPGLPNATIGVSYAVTVSAAGGTAPYTWSVSAGTLPTGLTLNSSTGVLNGLPTSSGSFQFTLQVSDSASVTAAKQFTLGVAQALTFTTSATLPSGATGTPYSLVLSATGGTPPYTFAIAGGTALPSGLSLGAANGLISGTPAASGTFAFTIQVRDSNSVSASQQFNLTVVSGLAITTQQLPQGAVNVPYSQTLTAAGGTSPYTWNLTQGSLPAGLSLTTAGVITGTPKANGAPTFTVQVLDSMGASATKQFTLTIAAGLAITSSVLPQGTLGVTYGPFTLAAVGGAQPCCTWSVSTGTMPTGLSLSSTGIVTGTPSAAGAFTFTVQAKDSNGVTATQIFTISIIPPTVPQVNVGAPPTTAAGQQISFGLSLASGYPLDVTCQVTLSFQPDAIAAAVDPAMQFSTGGVKASYTIPANSTKAVPIALQTGTVSGTITLSFTLAAGATELRDFQNTITIPRAVPQIQSVKLVRTSAGLEVHIVGFSSSRDLTEADLTFTAAPGATLQTTTVTEKLTSVATTWYQSTKSAQYGSQFMLVLPFTASQGSVDAVGSVSVVLKNAEGSSQSASGTL